MCSSQDGMQCERLGHDASLLTVKWWSCTGELHSLYHEDVVIAEEKSYAQRNCYISVFQNYFTKSLGRVQILRPSACKDIARHWKVGLRAHFSFPLKLGRRLRLESLPQAHHANFRLDCLGGIRLNALVCLRVGWVPCIRICITTSIS